MGVVAIEEILRREAFAGAHIAARRPPLMGDRCLRTQFISLMALIEECTQGTPGEQADLREHFDQKAARFEGAC